MSARADRQTKDMPKGDALSYRIAAMPAVTGLGRSTIYEEIRAGRLRAFKVGKATLIHRDDAEAWLDSYRRASAPPSST